MEHKTKYKTQWDLSVFYKNEKDPQIEKDVKATEKLCADFEKKYKNKDFISTPEKLLKALKDNEKLSHESRGTKLLRYFFFRKDLSAEDTVAQAMSTQIENRLTVAGNKLVFFGLSIAKIPANKQKTFLKDKHLAPYKYMLTKMFENAKHLLSEKEEQLESLLSQTSYSMWVDGQEKLLNSQTVEFKGEKLPIPKALSMVQDLPKDERRDLYAKIHVVFRSISHFAEAEINAIYNFKKVMDQMRGFKTPYESTLLSYENDEKTIKLLAELVTKNFKISHRFYRLHAKLLGEKKITRADRNVKIGKIKKKFDFETGASIVGEIFSKIGPKYREIFDKILSSGQFDAYPKKGKAGGAYCAPGHDVPTFILMNYVDNMDSVETLAHEMGHAVHTELSKSQPADYEDYTMSVAEVASTFFEQVVLSEMENHLSDDEKIILLHNKIVGDISTIFVQIACFNFELELHTRIRAEGQLSKEEIAKTLNKHMAACFGDAVELTENDGYFFVNWSHIRRFFYVYSYAYGQIISRALFENWKKDPSYIEKVDQFLSAGSSMSPEDIFKKAGIDTSNPKFFEAGLKSIEKDIEKLEKLTKVVTR